MKYIQHGVRVLQNNCFVCRKCPAPKVEEQGIRLVRAREKRKGRNVFHYGKFHTHDTLMLARERHASKNSSKVHWCKKNEGSNPCIIWCSILSSIPSNAPNSLCT